MKKKIPLTNTEQLAAELCAAMACARPQTIWFGGICRDMDTDVSGPAASLARESLWSIDSTALDGDEHAELWAEAEARIRNGEISQASFEVVRDTRVQKGNTDRLRPDAAARGCAPSWGIR